MSRITIITVAVLLAFGACKPKPPPPAPTPPPPTAKPTTTPTAKPTDKPKPPPKPEKPKSTKPAVPELDTMTRKDFPEPFVEVGKAFKGKLFDSAVTELDKVKELNKTGKLQRDQKMLLFALYGFSHAMQNQPKEAGRAYRRILPLWSNHRKFAKDLRKLETDEAKGEARVKLATDTLGEALFYVAEDKRAKADEITMPAYEGDSDRKKVLKHLNGKVKLWVNHRNQRIKSAVRAYEFVYKIQPTAPPRWTVAAASRIGAMHGLVLEELRGIKPPDAWKKEGKSEFVDPAKGKEPLEWKAVQDEFQAKLNELMDPVKASATEAYKACLDKTATSGATEDAFAKSCKDWLDANP